MSESAAQRVKEILKHITQSHTEPFKPQTPLRFSSSPRLSPLPIMENYDFQESHKSEDSEAKNIALLGTLGFFVLIASFVIWGCLRRRLAALDKNRIPDFSDPELAEAEASLVETLDEAARQNYERARVFQEAYPPDSVPTDITFTQLLSIQEKGVSAWEFEPDLHNTSSFVECRTEISFYDSECCVQTNLPLPKQQEIYYWEAKMYEKSPSTTVAVGLATKPYPTFRLPGWNRQSIAYFSDSGFKFFNSPFNGKAYGPQFHQGDVVGVGYRPRTGTIFFTRNGKKLDDAFTGMKMNLFPTVGANGPCCVHVNFGQLGFVFIEANVKKWGLAPTMGTLAPPPAYGSERDSILVASGSRSCPSINISRIVNTNVDIGRSNDLLSEAALDISLADIHLPPPSYSSVDQFPARSTAPDTPQPYPQTEDQNDSRRNSVSSDTYLLAEDP
ncbi:3948_t:CDS:2 [Paraglomus brasilianum]|uniref:3948_t:CDS:1 n=1 Tax=Paraglomus brasilianum TaxID=144538 RepID=A0A9N9FEV5_9GLOM|nr:3948_t:CDS:2 [Paraglomus brasilianum]